MIAYIQGKLTYKDPTMVIIETVGIGYQVKISLNTFGLIKDQEVIRLHTYLSIKEDAHTLFGFAEAEEKRLFMELISISGVGPGTALMVLSSLPPLELHQAIVNEDLRTIQAVKGIGAKTAQRIILELKDKLKKDTGLAQGESRPQAFAHNKLRSEALAALVTLGISKSIAEKNIDTILKKEGDAISVEHLIKLSLKSS
ncbi:MAG: Holliday junction branch migration protein RuvA [Cytophagales bacterium]|nr:MAG: Holliday junction branch migration protein RuvA [Cytophagales bacterium]